ncbi:aldose 1-epimerase family protein [Nocardioides sp. BP30]|uniref:aldose 1-epimerase family protein n=1 Tax=Nocardioides sp. BP30 TaxID=3036374 RepID=UPI0024684E9D|nr:aldose 1-epimerase family protein [Nocardioides sp. BP30]WGL51395.1 aldose 1-epimerase family protein [Nocardioides sp. BP30]
MSGAQVELRHGRYTAHIASVGASLRALRHDGRDLVVPFDADEVRPAYRGAALAPWPNRVVDGRYTFDGVAHRLPLTEPARCHALHGLAIWLDFAIAEQSATEVVLTATIEPQTGYPWRVPVTVHHTLTDDGLHTRISARNDSTTRAPVGLSGHPYLVAGRGRVDDWTLELPAERFLVVDEDRLIPQYVESVATDGTFDFRSARRIGATFIDHAFTALDRDRRGLATVRLTTAEGTGVGLAWDEASPWVQIHTADRPDAPDISRIGLAVEPMTCAPDAFNSEAGLIVLAPGESAAAGWTIFAI